MSTSFCVFLAELNSLEEQLEAFRERRVWQLGISSTLGFDTALAANAPDGMIVRPLTIASS